uniref:Uncharacterized protein n=1 Tax=Marmota marmota marmota TaxID=9994 RepID=A0A8C5Z4D1_MARMA
VLNPRGTCKPQWGKLGSLGTEERAPCCLGKDAEGLRVRVAYCVLGVDSLKLFSIKNSINILFTCNHQ